MKYGSFEKARKFVHSLKIENRKKWAEYCKSGKKPDAIPTAPRGVYKNKGWKGWGDWLGTGTISPRYRKFRSFEEARKFVRSLGLKTYEEWSAFTKTSKTPDDIPLNLYQTYGKEWKGIGDFLGTGKIANRDRVFRPFKEAKKRVKEHGFKSQKEYRDWWKKNRPNDLPSNAPREYKNKGWASWGDFLGTRFVATGLRQFKSFDEAKKIVRKLGLKNLAEYREWWKRIRPNDLPSNPPRTYKNKGWASWGDFLGTGFVGSIPKSKQYIPFEKARESIRKRKIKTNNEYVKLHQHGHIPSNIPRQPHRFYKLQGTWTSWGDFLGTEFVFARYRSYKSFEEARKIVRKLGLKNLAEYEDWWRKNKPDDLPSNASQAYKNKGWTNWGDFLGTGTIAPFLREFKSFAEARKYVQTLKFSGKDAYSKWATSKERPSDIPASPPKTYQEGWLGWYDFLGNEDTTWSPKNVKELLRSLIDSKLIYTFSEAILYSFLLRKGVLNLHNRHDDFLNNLAKASKTKAGLEAIKDYATSDSEFPPDISHYAPDEIQTDTEAEIKTATSEELANLVQDGKTLDSDEIIPVEQILSTAEVLDSISVDEEAIQFYLNYCINQLWKDAFLDERKTIIQLEKAGMSGNKYRDLVSGTFLKDYNASKNLKIPKNYIFNYDSKPVEPFLMQKYVAHKIKQLPYFGNFSGTGSGKTLSAILASRVIDSKVTLIICPNDVVSLWKKNAEQIFSDSHVTTHKDVFSAKRDESDNQYWVLNYDKLNQNSSRDNVEILGKQKIDFIVLDEIHFSKVTQDETKSKRRKMLEFLLTLARKKNPDLKVLGLSATPVVNNLREGKSLLELMSGKIYHDISTKSTVPNAVTLYEKITNNSIRQIPNYKLPIIEDINVEAERPTGTSLAELNSRPLAIEQHLTNVRIPQIIKRINGQTIIYTEYVGTAIPNKPSILENIGNAVKEKGFTYGFYSGDDHSGLELFLEKKIQVLIASRPISTGIDGLQKVCSNLIFNTLPWTHALYQQIVGRVVRTGQVKDRVTIHHIKASIGGYEYDEMKLNRLKFKRTLADCAVDGLLPEKNLVSAAQASREAIRWLARLERGEISCVTRRDLNRILPPIEIKKRQSKYGDFSKQNQKINTEKSITTHQRMLKNPEVWHEYHRIYRKERETWRTIPFNEWIKRIKKLSERFIIGDFGCGEAKIADEIGSRIINFDHVAIDSKVISCDMKDVSDHVKNGGLDVALFSLSLMSKNWQDYLKEASRCLNENGLLFISETTNSLTKRLETLRDEIKKLGFEIYKDSEIGLFTFIEARKL